VQRKPRVLLVDGDLDFVQATQSVLAKKGFEILCAHSAREGWEMVVYEQPDVIVLEVMLERHDSGFVLARAIKADPRFKHLPILFLTNVSDVTGFEFDMEKDGYWMKADDFLKKSMPMPDLISRINQLLEEEAV
jgi:DNA-binding response OmpR family regulator